MSWVILILAGVFEIGWAVGLKYTEGFTRLWASVGTVWSMLISVALLGIAMKSIPLGTAYAVWTGIGVLGTVMFEAILLPEQMTVAKLVCVGLIVTGVIGLKLVS